MDAANKYLGLFKLKEKLLLWLSCLLLVCYLLPNHYSPWLSVHQELGAALAFSPVLIWACVRVQRVSFLASLAAALALVPLVQMLAGQLSFSSDGWVASLYLFSFALAVTAGASFVQSAEDAQRTLLTHLRWPFVAIVLAALVSVGIQLHQWLILGSHGIWVAELPPNFRPFGNLAQPNQLATLLLLGIAGLLFVWESGRVSVITAVLAVLTLMFGLMLTGSRSVLLTLLWLVPAYFLLRRRCNLRTTGSAVLLAAAFYLLSSQSWSLFNDALLIGGDVNTAFERMSEAGIRTVLFTSMLDAVSRAPFLGFGWGQIGVAQTITSLDYPATHSFFDSSHNLFIDLALWNGLPIALVVVVGLLFWFVWQGVHCRDPLSFTVLAAVGVVFSHSMVEYPLNYAYFLLPVGLWMGTLSARQPSPLDVAMRAISLQVTKAVTRCVGAGVLLAFVIVVVEYFPFEEDWRLMQFQQKGIGSLAVTEPPPAMVLTGLHEFLRFSRTEARPNMSGQEIDWMRKVSERYGYAAPMFKFALAQALNGQAQGAQLTLRRLCQMQTPVACKSAREHWNELSKTQYRQLLAVPFPSEPSTTTAGS